MASLPERGHLKNLQIRRIHPNLSRFLEGGLASPDAHFPTQHILDQHRYKGLDCFLPVYQITKMDGQLHLKNRVPVTLLSHPTTAEPTRLGLGSSSSKKRGESIDWEKVSLFSLFFFFSGCLKCMIIYQKHFNVLQYRESKQSQHNMMRRGAQLIEMCSNLKMVAVTCFRTRL